jgi:hypothetical protein
MSLHVYFADQIDETDSPDHPFCDPITNEVFVDPVITPSGQTYDRSTLENILGWCDPESRQNIPKSSCYPNLRLRHAIECSLTKLVEKFFKHNNNAETVGNVMKIIPYLCDTSIESALTGQTLLIRYLKNLNYDDPDVDVGTLVNVLLIECNITKSSSAMREAIYDLFSHHRFVSAVKQILCRDVIENVLQLNRINDLDAKIPVITALYDHEIFTKWMRESASVSVLTEWIENIIGNLTTIDQLYCLSKLVSTRAELLPVTKNDDIALVAEQTRVQVVKNAGMFACKVTGHEEEMVHVSIGLKGTVKDFSSDICTVLWDKQEFTTVKDNNVTLGPFVAPIHRCYITEIED